MRDLIAFFKLLQWPAIFVLMAALTNDKCVSSIVVLMLAFRRDVSAVLRYRRLDVSGLGFRGHIDSVTKSNRNPPK